MRVKALGPMYYDRRMYAVGDEYDMDDREENEAKILSALGKVSIVKQPAVSTPPPYRVSEFKAQDETPAEEQKESAPEAEVMTTEDDALTPTKRVYRRRDMRAER